MQGIYRPTVRAFFLSEWAGLDADGYLYVGRGEIAGQTIPFDGWTPPDGSRVVLVVTVGLRPMDADASYPFKIRLTDPDDRDLPDPREFSPTPARPPWYEVGDEVSVTWTLPFPLSPWLVRPGTVYFRLEFEGQVIASLPFKTAVAGSTR